jgi:hypothetical protein
VGGEPKSQEAEDAIALADGVGSEEAEFAKQVLVVPVTASSADQGFPVVVEGLDAACWRAVV